jgi:hypothetical protein
MPQDDEERGREMERVLFRLRCAIHAARRERTSCPGSADFSLRGRHASRRTTQARASKASCACSRAAIACSRVTVEQGLERNARAYEDRSVPGISGSITIPEPVHSLDEIRFIIVGRSQAQKSSFGDPARKKRT